MKKSFILAVVTALFLSNVCVAQEIVPTVPACGLWRLDPDSVEMLGSFAAATVTLLPKDAVLCLDGELLAPFTPLSPAQLRRVMIFSGADNPGIGVTPLYRDEVPVTLTPRIRCINPVFQGNI